MTRCFSLALEALWDILKTMEVSYEQAAQPIENLQGRILLGLFLGRIGTAYAHHVIVDTDYVLKNKTSRRRAGGCPRGHRITRKDSFRALGSR